jgi:hypothetical protein
MSKGNSCTDSSCKMAWILLRSLEEVDLGGISVQGFSVLACFRS